MLVISNNYYYKPSSYNWKKYILTVPLTFYMRNALRRDSKADIGIKKWRKSALLNFEIYSQRSFESLTPSLAHCLV